SWTEPTGALVGTARYAAPEQGTGATLDARADLYALGIVLVESVTGRVPDVADTLIGTLAVRARVPLVAPEELGALGPVVERAGRSQPSERYPDAVTMADALADASRHLPPPGPLTLVGLDAQVEDPHPTELRRTSAVFDQDADSTVATARPPSARCSSSRCWWRPGCCWHGRRPAAPLPRRSSWGSRRTKPRREPQRPASSSTSSCATSTTRPAA